MGRPFDASRFRKSVTKNIDNFSFGFHDPKIWIPTGNYCLNYHVSGRFTNGIPLGKVTVFAGQSGSGKSYIVSGSVVKNAQDMGIFVVLIDSENALDEAWLQALGVDTSEDKLLKLNMSQINDVAKIMANFIKDQKAIPEEERSPVLFVVDSLGMLLTPTAVEQFEKGDLKGDMGIKPKQLKALVTNCVNTFGELNVGLIATNHTYESQDPYNPDDIVSGGSGFVFASSIVVAMKQLKLKENEEGEKTSEVHGIRAGCKIMKSRYAKPFETLEVRIPYETGMEEYSGLFDMFYKDGKGILKKDGNRYAYTDKNGEVHKYFKKEYNKNEDGILDLIMSEWDYDKHPIEPEEEEEIVGSDE